MALAPAGAAQRARDRAALGHVHPGHLLCAPGYRAVAFDDKLPASHRGHLARGL
jgi:hypothetical protein